MKAGFADRAEASVRISGDDAAGELRSLLSWLDGDDSLRGRGRVIGRPGPGEMGAATESLVLMLAPGGVATACATVLIAWIRSRSGSISIELSRPDGTRMRLDARNIRQLPRERLDELATRISGLLGKDPGDPGTAGSTAGGVSGR